MLIIGLICLILGFALGIYILWLIGIVLAVIGLVLLLLDFGLHRPVGGRHWY